MTAVSFTACRKEKPLTASSTLTTVDANGKSKTPARLKKLNAETKAWLEGKNVAVILGYGYNEEESISEITQNLNENFGVETEENKALISVFVYPNDFMVGGKARLSSLLDLIEDKTLAGMIILGSPEGLHMPLSKLQDKEESGLLPYPVFSFFPQDDVLGAESTSDFVLDYAHKTNQLDTEFSGFIPDFDLNSLLNNAISSMITLREPLKADQNLIEFVKKLFNSKKNVSHYIDGETGLQSINHFVFE